MGLRHTTHFQPSEKLSRGCLPVPTNADINSRLWCHSTTFVSLVLCHKKITCLFLGKQCQFLSSHKVNDSWSHYPISTFYKLVSMGFTSYKKNCPFCDKWMVSVSVFNTRSMILKISPTHWIPVSATWCILSLMSVFVGLTYIHLVTHPPTRHLPTSPTHPTQTTTIRHGVNSQLILWCMVVNCTSSASTVLVSPC